MEWARRVRPLWFALTAGLAATIVGATVVVAITSSPGPFTGCLGVHTNKGTVYAVAQSATTPYAACNSGDLQITFNNDTARAMAAEGVLTTNLGAETSRAQGAEGTLATNLAAETARAQGAEATLASKDSTEATRAQGAEGTLTTNLTAEATRAQGAEGTLTTNLANETTRAQGAEGTLTTNLATETTRAEDAESSIRTDTQYYVTNVAGQLSNDLSAHESRDDLFQQTDEKVYDASVHYTATADGTGVATLTSPALLDGLYITPLNALLNGDFSSCTSVRIQLMGGQAGVGIWAMFEWDPSFGVNLTGASPRTVAAASVFGSPDRVSPIQIIATATCNGAEVPSFSINFDFQAALPLDLP
jgi:hypothetical protein